MEETHRRKELVLPYIARKKKLSFSFINVNMVPESSKRLCLMKTGYKLGSAKLPYHFEFNFLIHKVSILVEIRVHKPNHL